MVVELDERRAPHTLELSSGLVTDIADPGLGYYSPTPRDVFDEVCSELRRRGIPCVHPVDPSGREFDMLWTLSDPDAASDADERCQLGVIVEESTWARTRCQIQLVRQGAPALQLTLDMPPGRLQAQAALAALAHSLLIGATGSGGVGARRIADGTVSFDITGQMDVHRAGASHIVHDVRTHPVAIRALIDELVRLAGQPPRVLVRPYPFTLRAYDDSELVSGFDGAEQVLLIPPYPGGRGDEMTRLVLALRNGGVDVDTASDGSAAKHILEELTTQPETPWLFIGGDDLARLAARIIDRIET